MAEIIVIVNMIDASFKIFEVIDNKITPTDNKYNGTL
tara:strand:- start:25 stop:135 length:111 start_codon:yes stop_codon:yes gene_type:complete